MEKLFKCNLCPRTYTQNQNLRRHCRLRHCKEISKKELPSVRKTSSCLSTVVCSECNKEFNYSYNLKRHKRNFHHEIEKMQQLDSDLVGSVVNQFQCKLCDCCYKNKRDLRVHEKRKHSDVIVVGNTSSRVNCSICSTSNFTVKSDLFKHYHEIHNVNIVDEELIFTSENEFKKWKYEIEVQTTSKFVKNGNRSKSKSGKCIYFDCNRSGYYSSRGKGLRHLKTQGTCKINTVCPAHIKLTILNNGEHVVKYCKTHVGHEKDLEHLTLTKCEREYLTTKIASKFSYETILNDIRESVDSEGPLKRLHLLTRQDLHNLRQNSNLNILSEPANKNNSSESPSDLGSSCVLFRKNKGCVNDEYSELNENDYVLVSMSNHQSLMLKQFGSSLICIDSICGLNDDHNLVTLLVLDEFHQGFPCAFIFANRIDYVVMKIFLQTIKEKVGLVKPRVFMSDMPEYFFKSWMDVMGEPEFRLYCTWKLKIAWHSNLATRIKNRKKRNLLYSQLVTAMSNTNEATFMLHYNHLIDELLSDPETQSFGDYFVENYSKNINLWALCFRLQCDIDINRYADALQRIMKYIGLYLNNKEIHNLDKSLDMVMQFVSDKVFDRIITMHKGKVTTKLRHLRDRHVQSLALDTSGIVLEVVADETDGSSIAWLVPSSSSSEPETVYRVTDKRQDWSCVCKLICKDCNVCIHRFKCTCADNYVKWNMCEHIHLVCRLIKEEYGSVSVVSILGNVEVKLPEHTVNIAVKEDQP